MALSRGSRLGPYEILSPLGAGGMGEVYRARDMKLGREVAIKVLPEALVDDPERIARFEREAKTLAALNHPHIAHIHGLEESNGVRALVMELAEGPTLAERIARGPIPIDESLAIAKQIAEALEAAHEQGIIHRDLKPANIKVRDDGTVKVLDFGLAKALEPNSGAAVPSVTASPTITSPALMTGVGVLLGTAAYMSPEQAKGRPADKRSDIWAFGCVLYEMLTGARPFEGDDVSETLASILKSEPDWTRLPAGTPSSVLRLLRRALSKDRTKRSADAATLRLDLDDASEVGSPTAAASAARATPRWRSAAVALGAAILAATAAAAIAWAIKPTPPRHVARFTIALPPGEAFSTPVRSEMDVSPDGTKIVYESNRRLHVRALADLTPVAITAPSAAGVPMINPIFSPDGQSIAFYNDRAIKVVPVGGGPVRTLCAIDAVSAPFGMSWSANGVLFEDSTRGIMRCSSNGGTPDVLVPIKPGELFHAPQMLPDGRTVMFSVAAGASALAAAATGAWQIVAQPIGSDERKALVQNATEARYTPTGHVIYASHGSLFAARFDARRNEIAGPSIAVVEGVRADVTTTHYAISPGGTLIYVPGPVTGIGGNGVQPLALFDRRGANEPLKLAAAVYETPRVSPDGHQLAVSIDDGREQSIWIYELSGASSIRRLTFGGSNRFPIWSFDGRSIAFQSNREGAAAVFQQKADGTEPAVRLTKPIPGALHTPHSWSPDGAHLLFDETKGVEFSLMVFSSADGRVAPFPGVPASRTPSNALFSPDGRWVAYQSTETGFMQLFVQPFPPSGVKYQLTKTATSSHYPLWTHDGKEILFVPGRGLFGVIGVTTQPAFAWTEPQPLPRGTFYEGGPGGSRSYDLVADGRLIAPVSPEITPLGVAVPPIHVVLNWFEELRARVPPK